MKRAAALAGCVLVAGCTSLNAPTAVEPAPGYLSAAAMDLLAGQVDPPPEMGPQAHEAARHVFDVVKPGTDRWWLAIAHAELRPPEAAQHFDCVLGARLTVKPRPALARVMNRLLADSDTLTRRLAAQAHRPRPIALLRGLEPCQRVNDALRDGPSWPAGGAVAGSAYGELFAALAPDQAADARRMGREIGASRVMCRMNWDIDVADGQRLGGTLYAQASANPQFAADLAAARAEVEAARAESLTNPGCAAERRALSQAGRGATSAP